MFCTKHSILEQTIYIHDAYVSSNIATPLILKHFLEVANEKLIHQKCIELLMI